MATTANYGWPKPALTDTPNGPTQIGALADAIDTTLDTALIGAGGGDVALQHNTGLTLSASTGFGSLDYSWQVRNGWTMLLVEVARTGSTITAAANGNIGNTQLVALGTHRPPVQVPVVAYLVTIGVGGFAVLYPTGDLYLLSIQPSGTVAAGNVIRCYFTYPA